jgi:hypothetical protein
MRKKNINVQVIFPYPICPKVAVEVVGAEGAEGSKRPDLIGTSLI